MKRGKSSVVAQGLLVWAGMLLGMQCVQGADTTDAKQTEKKTAQSATKKPAREIDVNKALLRVSVRDADTGKLIPCRIHVLDEKNNWHPEDVASVDPQGSAIPYSKVTTRFAMGSEQHTTMSAHPFVVDVPPGKYTLTVERGKEYHPVTREVTVTDQPTELEIPLQRWIDMAARGWYSGDTHVHRSLKDLANVMLAEDINVTLPISYWTNLSSLPPEHKIDAPPRVTEFDKTHVAYPMNTEYEIFWIGKEKTKKNTHILGAFLILNHKRPFQQITPPVAPIAEQAHEDGALIGLEKNNWTWSMMLVPVMKVNLYELWNNHLWRSVFAIPKWEQEPGAYMHIERNAKGWTEWGWIDFGFQNYYALLDCGFRLKPTAGNASGVLPTTLGFGRVYVHLPEGFSYDAWIKGLAAGRSFVSNGPMMFVEFNGQPPGHTFKQASTEAQDYRVHGTVVSGEPLSRIEIVANGEIRQTIKPENRKSPGGSYTSAIDEKVRVDGTTWIAVRAFEDRADKRIRFVHCSPVFVDVEGRPLRPRKVELDYLIKRVEDQIAFNQGWLDKESIDEYFQALRVYRSITPREEGK